MKIFGNDKPKTRPVLLDRSFIDALHAPASPSHPAALTLYNTLIDRYEAGLDRLHALSTVLEELPRDVRRGALAPVIGSCVSRQHRSAGRRVDSPMSTDAALALVVMRRERIRTVATAGRDFEGLDLEVLSVAGDASVYDESAVATGPD